MVKRKGGPPPVPGAAGRKNVPPAVWVRMKGRAWATKVPGAAVPGRGRQGAGPEGEVGGGAGGTNEEETD